MDKEFANYQPPTQQTNSSPEIEEERKMGKPKMQSRVTFKEDHQRTGPSSREILKSQQVKTGLSEPYQMHDMSH